MTTTTPKGISYAQSSDHTRLWEHYQGQAETTDDIMPGHVARATGPGSTTDYTTAANAVSVNVSVINGRMYRITGYVLAQQITANGAPNCKILDGAGDLAPAARLSPLAGGLTILSSATITGTGVAYFVASSTTTKTFNLNIQDSAGALRVAADAAWLLVEDIGLA